MSIQEIIASLVITILPLGLLIPETDLSCDGDLGGVYFDSKIYVCDGDNNKFIIGHEQGHAIYENLTIEDKENYLKLYQEAKKRGISMFYDNYAMSDVEEDWATNYSLIKNKTKSKVGLNKRKKIILHILNYN